MNSDLTRVVDGEPDDGVAPVRDGDRILLDKAFLSLRVMPPAASRAATSATDVWLQENIES